MTKTTISFRVTEEIKSTLENLKGDQESQTFLESLIATYQKYDFEQPELQISSQARAEIKTLGNTLQKSINSMTALVELAEQEKENARAQIQELTAQKDGLIAELQDNLNKEKEEKKLLNDLVIDKNKEVDELKKSIGSLTQNIENISELKNAWQDKENSLNSRISELIKENQNNKEKLKHLDQYREENTKLLHNLELAKKDLEYQNRKAEELQNEVEGLISDYKALATEKENLLQKNHELEISLARLEQKIGSSSSNILK